MKLGIQNPRKKDDQASTRFTLPSDEVGYSPSKKEKGRKERKKVRKQKEGKKDRRFPNIGLIKQSNTHT